MTAETGARLAGVARPVPPVSDPMVSIVIVTFHSEAWIGEAIDAVIRNTPPVYELLIVDNGSADATLAAVAARGDAITCLALGRNAGFSVANDLGARHARAPYLCFLNPDAFVQEGWLDALFAVLELPGAGIAVPQFRHPDGSLQEAGVVYAGDGRSLQVGFNDDPLMPDHQFVRAVASGEGACMLMSRAAFAELGGFDPVFSPALCEDTDLCFAARERLRLRTVYTPEAVVVHRQGVSFDPARAWRLMELNTRVIRERYGAELIGAAAHRELERLGASYHAARAWWMPDRYLVLAATVPDPERVLAAVGTGLDRFATVVSARGDGGSAAARALRRDGVEVVCAVRDWGRWFGARRAFYTHRLSIDAPPELTALADATQFACVEARS